MQRRHGAANAQRAEEEGLPGHPTRQARIAGLMNSATRGNTLANQRTNGVAMQVHFSNIKWNTNGRTVAGLPEEVTVEVGNNVDVLLEGADELSLRYGWLVDAFSFKVLEPTT